MSASADDVFAEVSYIAYHFHWRLDDILDLEGPLRKRFVREIEALNAALARLNAHASSGPPTHIGRLDVEAAVERWREDRQQRGAD